jgi:hypothetical protein
MCSELVKDDQLCLVEHVSQCLAIGGKMARLRQALMVFPRVNNLVCLYVRGARAINDVYQTSPARATFLQRRFPL